jgi:hypothetical protein
MEADAIDDVEALLEAARHDEARGRLASVDLTERHDAALHVRVARAAERAGDLDRAVLEYNLALRDEPDAVDVLRRLARLRVDQGEARRAERVLRRLLQVAPEDVEASLELAALLDDDGRTDEARAVLEAAPAEPRLADAAARLGWSSGELASDAEPPSADVPREHDAVLFAELFAGREGVHARQWRSATGKHGYTPVHEPLSPQVARNHLLGNVTVGVYPVRQDQTVLFLAFDVDVARFALARGAEAGDGRALAGPFGRAHAVACRLVDAAAAAGLAAYLEDSGWKGRHVWLFFAEPVPAGGARRLAEMLLRAAGPVPEDVQVEVFPKQSRVARDALGNLIKLPLGVHRVTGRRCAFVDAAGRPVARPFELLRRVERIPREALRRLLAQPEREAADTTPPAGGFEADGGMPFVEEDPWAETDETDPDALAPSAYTPPWRLEDDVDYQWLLRGCAVLREIARRAATGLLERAEQHVLVYTIGHLGEGARAVNAVLGGLFNVDRAMLLKSPLRGHPMSCPKVRARVPGIAAAVGCNCRFAPDAGMYPHPLLHLQSLRARGVMGNEPSRVSTLQTERMVGDLVRARAEQRRLQALVRDVENGLRGLMRSLAVDRLDTAEGALHLDADGRLTLTVEAPGASSEPQETGDGGVRDGAGRRSGTPAGEAGRAEGPAPAGDDPD